MTESIDSQILEHLRHIRAKVDSRDEELRRVSTRLGTIEQHIGAFHASHADQSAEIDRLRRRIDRIEQHLVIGEP